MSKKFKVAPRLDLLDEHINTLNLPMRVMNTLESAGIFSVEDLLNRTQLDLLLLPNFNEKTLSTVLDSLERVGFYAKSRYRPGNDFKKEPVRKRRDVGNVSSVKKDRRSD